MPGPGLNKQAPRHQPREALKAGLRNLSRLYRGPDADVCQSLRDDTFFQPFQELARSTRLIPLKILDQLKVVANGYSDPDHLCSALEETYVRLFVNARGGITAPLYQSCYAHDNAPMMGAAAAEMLKRFESKGLSMGAEINEPPDHLSIELEYLYYLLETGWVKNSPELLDEAVSFAGDVLIPWLNQFFNRLPEDTASRCYLLSTSLLLSMLQSITAKEPPLFY